MQQNFFLGNYLVLLKEIHKRRKTFKLLRLTTFKLF